MSALAVPLILRLRRATASLQLTTGLLRLRAAIERRYNPDQPRVPSGHPAGGQWTDGTGGDAPGDGRVDSGDATRARIAENEDQGRYTRDLRRDEGLGGGTGHTIRRHVGRSADDLAAELDKQFVRRETAQTRATVWEPRVGGFASIESANDFVNQTLRANKAIVDQVASGKVDKTTLLLRIGSKTGIEAIRLDADNSVKVRNNYAIKVAIQHDPRDKQGYKILTAYPWNQDDKCDPILGAQDDEF